MFLGLRRFCYNFRQRSGLGEGRQIQEHFRAEPHYKYIFIQRQGQHVAGFRQASCEQQFL